MTDAMDTLFRIMKLKGFSDAEFARRLGVTRSYICSMKKKGINATICKYKEMADILNCEIILVDKDSGLKYKL